MFCILYIALHDRANLNTERACSIDAKLSQDEHREG